MTRAKVDPALRKRTANACQNCKRRKQKVSGVSRTNVYFRHFFKPRVVDLAKTSTSPFVQDARQDGRVLRARSRNYVHRELLSRHLGHPLEGVRKSLP